MNIYNKIFSFIRGLGDLNYLIIQIVNSFKGGIPLSKSNYDYFNNFFNRINIGVNSGTFCFFDVGANDGWFAKVVLRFAPGAEIISFEPLQSQHIHLQVLKQEYSNFKFYPFALGSQNDSVEINEYGESGLSSIFEFADNSYSYKTRNFSIKKVNSYLVDCNKLDDLNYLTSGKEKKLKILKIDTQGYEIQVLNGAKNLLENKYFDFVMIEVLTTEKYIGGPLYIEVINMMHSYGYHLCELVTSCRETNGWVTEFDVIFSKESFSENSSGIQSR